MNAVDTARLMLIYKEKIGQILTSNFVFIHIEVSFFLPRLRKLVQHLTERSHSSLPPVPVAWRERSLRIHPRHS